MGNSALSVTGSVIVIHYKMCSNSVIENATTLSSHDTLHQTKMSFGDAGSIVLQEQNSFLNI